VHFEYGNTGSADRTVVDKFLCLLPPGAIVVNLGAGINFQGDLTNFAAALGRYQPKSTLILADLYIDRVNHKKTISGPERVRFFRLNAGRASKRLGSGKVDLMVAFGLFGALAAATTEEGTNHEAWPAVLRECFTSLKSGRHLIVSNSVLRQPIDKFCGAAKAARFHVEYQHVSPSAFSNGPNEQRYLVVLTKPVEVKHPG
jgi:hypothetical protein